MDYEWHYFLETLKDDRAAAGRSSGKGKVKPVAEDKAKILHDGLLYSFREYRHSSGEKRKAMDTLLRLHAEVCHVRSEDPILKRRHNVLVYKYVVETIASSNVIAKKLGISKITLYNDLRIVCREMALLCMGVPYLLYEGKGKPVVLQVLEDYQFLIRCPAAGTAVLFPVKLQKEVIRYQQATAGYLKRFNKCISLYDGFCSGSRSELDRRRNGILHKVFVHGGMSAEGLSVEYGCSLGTIYNDLTVNGERLEELLHTI